MPNQRHEVYHALYNGSGDYRLEAKLPNGRIIVGEVAIGAELDRLRDAIDRHEAALGVAAELMGGEVWRKLFLQVADMILHEREVAREDFRRVGPTVFKLREEIQQHGRTHSCDTDRDNRDAIGHSGTC